MDHAEPTSVARCQRRVGRYEVYEEIASGGMATVHLGRLLGEGGFSTAVAIKRLHPQFAKMPEFSRRFIDEARLAARVRHPNVVATLDVVEESGELLLVMEYVAGESLAGLGTAAEAMGERMPLRVALRIAADALYGLHAAHQAKDENREPLKIVHRDVSPQNILVGTDGLARVLDFGIAKAATSIHTTREGQLKGKLRYMAPEQIQDGPLSASTDVYGLSVTLWEVLTGERLFTGSNDAASMAKVLAGVVVKPSKLAPRVPPSVDAIVMRGLSRDAGLRFQTAEEMAIALESTGELALPREVSEWVGRVAEKALAERADRVSAALRATVEPPRARRSRRWLVFALAPAVLAAAAPFVVRASHHAEAAPPVVPEPSPASLPSSSESVATAPMPSPSAEIPVPSPSPSASTAPPSTAATAATVKARPPKRPAAVHACSPPYVEDAMGIRHIKPECLKPQR